MCCKDKDILYLNNKDEKTEGDRDTNILLALILTRIHNMKIHLFLALILH